MKYHTQQVVIGPVVSSCWNHLIFLLLLNDIQQVALFPTSQMTIKTFNFTKAEKHLIPATQLLEQCSEKI
jgi:hypothetical protein